MSMKLNILVADDSLTYRMMIKELLEDNDYNVQLAVNGIEATQIIRKNPPDLAILDIIMPEMDGIELCQVIKSNDTTRFIPVILLTSKDDPTDRIHGLESGADDYLTKPFNEEELIAKLKTLLRIRHLQGELGQSFFSQKSLVLVADDSLTVRKDLELLLDKSGYRAILVENGLEALDAVNHHLPDLAVLDVIMPKLDGIEVCRKIKENPATRQVPVIIITSKTDIDDKIRGLNAGADDYLFKPYHPKEFIAKVNAIFRMKKMQLEAERNILAKTNLELQEVNRKLKDTQSQLIQNEKMVALGQLVAGIAHEINNPLGFIINNTYICRNAIKGYHRLIDAYGELKPDLADPLHDKLRHIETIEQDIDFAFLKKELPGLFDDLENGLDRIRKIVLDLRNFSRLDEAEQKEVDMAEGIESTLNLLNHKLKGRIRIIRDYGDVPPVSCYPGRLNQVFMNILMNSIQAISDQGTITIRVFVENGYVCIRIIDNGHGIPEDILSRIFEPFFTTKQVNEGTGLGLSISYRIIEQHNGSISYTSTPEEGTACTIKLPISSE